MKKANEIKRKPVMLILTAFELFELFNYIRKLQTSFLWFNKTIMQCLFNEVQQSHISSKMLPWQTTEAFE